MDGGPHISPENRNTFGSPSFSLFCVSATSLSGIVGRDLRTPQQGFPSSIFLCTFAASEHLREKMTACDAGQEVDVFENVGALEIVKRRVNLEQMSILNRLMSKEQ